MPTAVTFEKALEALADRVLDDIRELLETHSSLRWRNPDQGDLYCVGPAHAFDELKEGGKRLQSEILKRFPRLFGLFRTILQNAPEHDQKTVAEVEKECRDVVEQNYMTWHKSTEAAHGAIGKRMKESLTAVAVLHDAPKGVC